MLDVREEGPFSRAHPLFAISLPLSRLEVLAYRLLPRRSVPVVVNCAGRTRSIIGTQSRINAGLPNRMMALRNGTIGSCPWDWRNSAIAV